MVANAAQCRASAELLLHDMLERMEDLAAQEDWQRAEATAEKVCAVAMQLPVGERREAIALVQSTISRVESRARGAKRTVAERLSTIRRGRSASKAYEG